MVTLTGHRKDLMSPGSGFLKFKKHLVAGLRGTAMSRRRFPVGDELSLQISCHYQHQEKPTAAVGGGVHVGGKQVT